MRKILLNEGQKSQILDLYILGDSRKNISRTLKISEHAIRKLIEQSDLLERPYKYIGKKFGKLLILSRTGTHKNGSPIVECLCDCGTIKSVLMTNLTSNSSLTISCGCYNRTKNLSKNPWKTEYNAYLYNVIKQRHFSFELSVIEFEKFCSAKCHYCNCLPSQKMQVGRGFKNGIDRIDNTIGYTLNNCVTCCWNCNRMKGKMLSKDFLAHINNIYKHSLLVQGIGFEPISDQSE